MEIITCEIYIPNKNLDMLKEKLRNLGNRYIEEDNELLNVSRHKLARAGNAALALKACHFNPEFDSDNNIVNLSLTKNKPIPLSVLMDVFAPSVADKGYIFFSDETCNKERIFVFLNGNAYELNDYDEFGIFMQKRVPKTKEKIHCKACELYIKGQCMIYPTNKVIIQMLRDPEDFCSCGTPKEGLYE